MDQDFVGAWAEGTVVRCTFPRHNPFDTQGMTAGSAADLARCHNVVHHGAPPEWPVGPNT